MAKSKTIRRISDLTPDPANANKGTERGVGLLERSLRQFGAGRSILVDRNGVVIAGNKTLEQAAAIGLEDLVVVQTDGKKLVAVQRMDLDLARDKRARALALADNRIAELDLKWDAVTLADQISGLAEMDIEKFFTEAEVGKMLQAEDAAAADDAEGSASKTYTCPNCGEKFTTESAWSRRKVGDKK